MANLSAIDDMPNITANFSDDINEHHEAPYERIFLEMFTAVGLLSIIANILIIFVILKYKKMREDATNMIFLQVNILQAVYLLATPLTLRVSRAFFDFFPVHMKVFCVFSQIENMVLVAMTWFLFLLVCDWYLKRYCQERYVRFCRVYKFFVTFLYVSIGLACSITLQFCFRTRMVRITYLVMTACIGLFVLFLIIIMNALHAIKKKKVLPSYRKDNIGLAVTNIFSLLWCPTLVFFLLVKNQGPVLLIILLVLGFSSPVFNLIYLYFYDGNYNVFLKQVFRCKCNEYKNLNLEDQSVNYNDVNGVQFPEN